uniref:Uncharacterized protein n=1 Tax=candidate division WOR-3 bacterium TaxID=2052148 RepID=A0A7C4Y630_UNCW3
MRPKSVIIFILGIILIIAGVTNFLLNKNTFLLITAIYGISITYLGLKKSRTALAIFGHTCIIMGCFLITWGFYLLPFAKPEIACIFGMPLFWGLLSLFGGICANYHSFCKCISLPKN